MTAEAKLAAPPEAKLPVSVDGTPASVESPHPAPSLESPQAWAEIAEQTWSKAVDTITENPWAAAGTAAAIGLAGAGVYLRLRGYGYKQMVARSLMSEAHAINAAREAEMGLASMGARHSTLPGRAGMGIGGDFANAPVGLGQFPSPHVFNFTKNGAHLTDLHGRASSSFGNFRDWLQHRVPLTRIDPHTEITRLGNNQIVLRSDLEMSFARSQRNTFEAVDHATGFARLYETAAPVTTRTDIFANGRLGVRYLRDGQAEQASNIRNWIDKAADGTSLRNRWKGI
jgi:hypothetical protein